MSRLLRRNVPLLLTDGEIQSVPGDAGEMFAAHPTPRDPAMWAVSVRRFDVDEWIRVYGGSGRKPGLPPKQAMQIAELLQELCDLGMEWLDAAEQWERAPFTKGLPFIPMGDSGLILFRDIVDYHVCTRLKACGRLEIPEYA